MRFRGQANSWGNIFQGVRMIRTNCRMRWRGTDAAERQAQAQLRIGLMDWWGEERGEADKSIARPNELLDNSFLSSGRRGFTKLDRALLSLLPRPRALRVA